MREVKFRAWIHEDSDFECDKKPCMSTNFVFEEYMSVNDALYVMQSHMHVLMQYTGLKDKNGCEIYEGDVLFHPLQGARQVIYPFDENVAAFGLKSSNGMINTLQDADKLYEIIGNIYENPELLEETK